MNFYKYLENKITLFESTNTDKYLYKNKTLYPIINDTVFVNDQEIKTSDNNFFKKSFNSDFTYDLKNQDIKIISFHKDDLDKKELDKKDSPNLTPQYVEINGIYFPISEIENYKKISKDNDLKNLNLDEYKIIKQQKINFKIYTKGSSNAASSQPTEAEINELEALGGETPPEETPPEETPPT